MNTALRDLGFDALDLIHAGGDTFAIAKGIRAVDSGASFMTSNRWRPPA
jgi:hypothetical protein